MAIFIGEKSGSEEYLQMLKNSIIFVVLFLLMLILANVSFGESEEQSAFISAVRGAVSAIDGDGVVRRLKKGDRINVGEYVFTLASSRVKIVCNDDTIITLGQESTIRFDNYFWEKQNAKGHFKVTVTEGLFRIIGGKITKATPENFKTHSPAATIGIRGSSFGGRMREDTLQVYLESGKGIDVYNEYGTVALLSPGMGTSVTAGEKPGRATLFSYEFINDINSGTDSGGGKSGGSVIQGGSTIINRAVIRNSTNISIGKNSRANMGSVTIRKSNVSGTTIVNDAKINDSVNTSSGRESSASMGSIDIE